MSDKFAKDYRKVAREAFKYLKNENVVHKWMSLKNEAFMLSSPIEMIKQGKTGKVLKVIRRYIEKHTPTKS